MLDRIGNAIKSMVTRATVTGSRIGPRTFLQITGLTGTQQMVELLLPPGYSARPVAGADVVKLQVLGTADHVVCLGGDMPGHAIQDLAPGEFGLNDGTQMVVFRQGYLQMVAPTYILATTPELRCSGKVTANYGGSGSVSLGTHTHGPGAGGHTGAPDAGT